MRNFFKKMMDTLRTLAQQAKEELESRPTRVVPVAERVFLRKL